MPRQADPTLVDMWRELADAIASGEIQGLFVVWEYGEGALKHGCAYRANDLDLLLQEVRNHAIRVRTRHTN